MDIDSISRVWKAAPLRKQGSDGRVEVGGIRVGSNVNSGESTVR
jgi:hypothetical protein